MSFNITVEGGTSVRLPTAGKYCDRDIVVTAEGGGLSLDVVTASALPDTVVDGQIVVITSTPPGTVYIDTDEPALPASGDVWVKLEAGADVVLALSEESPFLRMGLIRTVQLNNGIWEYRSGYLGAGGAWEQFSEALPPIGITLEDATWEQIAAVSASGKADEYWAIGDQKTTNIHGTSYPIIVIGLNHDDLDATDAKYGDNGYNGGSKKAGISFQTKDLYGTRYAMNSSGSNTTGWNDCDMRKTRMPYIYSGMESELQKVIRTVKKMAGSGGSGGGTAIASDDTLFLLAEKEVFNTTNKSTTGEGNQYAYYAAGNSKSKNYHYWLRSPSKSGTSYFCHVVNNGSLGDYGGASNSYGVMFGFCV